MGRPSSADSATTRLSRFSAPGRSARRRSRRPSPGAGRGPTHAGAELDLLVQAGNKRLGFEFKRTVSPKITRSMRTALDDLALDELILVHGGPDSYPMDRRIRALAAARLEADLPRPRRRA